MRINQAVYDKLSGAEYQALKRIEEIDDTPWPFGITADEAAIRILLHTVFMYEDSIGQARKSIIQSAGYNHNTGRYTLTGEEA